MTSLAYGRCLGFLLSRQGTWLSELLTAVCVYSEHVPFCYSPQAVPPLPALGTLVVMQTALHRNQHLSKAENNTGFEASLEVILHACKNDSNVLLSLSVYRFTNQSSIKHSRQSHRIQR